MIKNLEPKHHFVFDGTVINIYHANPSEGLTKHEHKYAHATVCYNGSILITKENVKVELNKYSNPVVLVAGEWHEIEALEEGTVFSNIFSEKYIG